MDVHSKETRSFNMSRIKSKNTKPELLVRKYLFKNGYRYRKNVKGLPGCPDVVLPKYKTVIFVNGCFWHMHKNCSDFVWPATNYKFWHDKLTKNAERDKQKKAALLEMGWNVITVWECELKKPDARLRKLVGEIESASEKMDEN